MDCSPFTPSEIAKVIKRTKPASTPSPFDRVGYNIFKKCSSDPSPCRHLQLLLDTLIHPCAGEDCSSQTDCQGTSCQRCHQPSQLPAHCTYTMHRQDFHHSPAEPLADLHVHAAKWVHVPRSISPEGLHAHCTRLYRAPPQAFLHLS